jgi:hypothetical protein
MKRAAVVAYALASSLFVLGVLAQVFLAGLVVVSRVASWESHIGLGHGLGLALLVMLLCAYLGRMPARTKRLTWLLFAVYFIQADVLIFLRQSVPYAAALHPVLALIDFVLGWHLTRQGLKLLQQPGKEGVAAVRTAVGQ